MRSAPVARPKPPNLPIAADLAEEIYGYTGWLAGKKKSARKEPIQALRGVGA